MISLSNKPFILSVQALNSNRIGFKSIDRLKVCQKKSILIFPTINRIGSISGTEPSYLVEYFQCNANSYIICTN